MPCVPPRLPCPAPQLWREARPALTVQALHAHVMGLHRAFLAGLGAVRHPTINTATLLQPHQVGLRGRVFLCWRSRPPAALACCRLAHRRCCGLCTAQDEARRSHTLVFAQPSAAAAKGAVDALAARGVLVDCRKACVRLGFGPYHDTADVEALLEALKACAT